MPEDREDLENTNEEENSQEQAATNTLQEDDFKSEHSKRAVLADLKKERTARQQLQSELEELKQQTLSEHEKQLEQAKKEAAKPWRNKFIRAEAKATLAEMGLSSGTDRMVNLINFDDIEVDEDGTIVSGLTDQVKALKTDFPELFKKKGKNVVEGGKEKTPPGSNKEQTTGDVLAQRVLGKK